MIETLVKLSRKVEARFHALYIFTPDTWCNKCMERPVRSHDATHKSD